MSAVLPSKIFYVYLHQDPITKEVVYAGKGKYGRAWDVTRCRADNHAHTTWMKEQSEKGYLPTEWVIILKRDLSETEAYKTENDYIVANTPRFNRGQQIGEKNYQAKLTDDQARELFVRSHKERIGDLAKEFAVSPAAIYHIKNRKQWRTATAGL